jgi:Na+/H+-dicarboxylate symporter
MIPQNPLESLAKGEMVPIIFFALIFSLALSKVGEINRPIVSFFESVFAATMKITDWIMVFAAPGIFALTTTAVASYGLSIFSTISKFFAVVFVGFCIQFFVVYPMVLKVFSKVPVGTFYTAIIEALLVAFGTASSSATLPLTIACCEKRGISHKVCSFVLPLGATLNMDGTALFQVVSVIFLTQAYGVTLDPLQIIEIMLLVIIASSTSAGIPGAGLITIALVLNGLGLTPQQLVEGFAFLFAIDRVVDMLRTTVNVASDAVVAAVIADNENEIDYDLLNNPEQYKEII